MSQEDFTIYDLMKELIEDESWEENPEMRQTIANGLVISLVGR